MVAMTVSAIPPGRGARSAACGADLAGSWCAGAAGAGGTTEGTGATDTTDADTDAGNAITGEGAGADRASSTAAITSAIVFRRPRLLSAGGGGRASRVLSTLRISARLTDSIPSSSSSSASSRRTDLG